MGDARSAMNLSTVNTTDLDEAEEASSNDDTFAWLSEGEISMALGLGEASNEVRRKVGVASRSIYQTTEQWPWEWVGLHPPKCWKLSMVLYLARVLQYVARDTSGSNGPKDKPTFENVRAYIRERAHTRGKLAPLKSSDFGDAVWYFVTRQRESEAAADKKKPGSCGRIQADVEEDQDEEHVDNSIANGEQHSHARDTDNQCDKDNNGQAHKSSEASAPPLSMSNNPGVVAVPEKRVEFKSPNAPHGAVAPSTSSKKRARPEDTSSNPPFAVTGRPSQKRCLGRNESIDESEPVVPPHKDTAATMTEEEELATLHAVVERRQTESGQEATNMMAKAHTLRDKLKDQKISLKAGTIPTFDSRARLESYHLARIESIDKLHMLQQTIEHYQANKSLHATIDHETRELIVTGHERRLNGMNQQLDKAEARVERAQRVVDAEVEEAKKRIEKNEAELRNMEEDMARAENEQKRWLCIKSLAAMEANDPRKVLAGFEKEGQGLLGRLEKRD
ncbi:hypothetical protein LCI18_003572 [Fusarium solani-melongenae]|uniref:Uncharacterized protein n=1 Tax=Fusarium solani subsp. cucurbitae TaxID=2747967 RepID=A0ACD3YUI3_FUSSC|nr:hypothetical protein LCI18_003572 [Fusarium solani-melongenae]